MTHLREDPSAKTKHAADVLRLVETPTMLQAGMVSAAHATLYTVELERCMAQVARVLADIAPTPAIQGRYDEHKRQKGADAKPYPDWLNGVLIPSAQRAGGKWVSSLEDATGASIAHDVAGAVGTMLEWRNSYVHANGTIEDLINAFNGGVVKTWGLASTTLVLATLKGVSVKLSTP